MCVSLLGARLINKVKPMFVSLHPHCWGEKRSKYVESNKIKCTIVCSVNVTFIGGLQKHTHETRHRGR